VEIEWSQGTMSVLAKDSLPGRGTVKSDHSGRTKHAVGELGNCPFLRINLDLHLSPALDDLTCEHDQS
jgi:hypothetical protein